MLRHFFTLIWNKRKTHALLIVEIWASFLVLFGVLTFLLSNLRNYREPIGFSYEQVWSMELTNNQDTTDVPAKVESILRRIRGYPEVESASRMSSNTPFTMNNMNNSVSYQNASTLAEFYRTDESLYRTLDITMQKGRWFGPQDRSARYTPLVINQKLQEKLFPGENPIGKTIKKDDTHFWKVVGVVETFKGKGEYMNNTPAIFEPLTEKDWDMSILIKTRPGTDATFEANLVKDVLAMVRNWGAEVTYLTESRKTQHNLTLVPVIIFGIISTFLLINVGLGLFGVLNLNIARRRGEIGLRRAMGATEKSISLQFLGEIWVLASFSILLGLLFAVQFPLLHVFDMDAGIYLLAMAVAVVVIYLIVTLCAWYPSRQASLIAPAVALHED